MPKGVVWRSRRPGFFFSDLPLPPPPQKGGRCHQEVARGVVVGRRGSSWSSSPHWLTSPDPGFDLWKTPQSRAVGPRVDDWTGHVRVFVEVAAYAIALRETEKSATSCASIRSSVGTSGMTRKDRQQLSLSHRDDMIHCCRHRWPRRCANTPGPGQDLLEVSTWRRVRARATARDGGGWLASYRRDADGRRTWRVRPFVVAVLSGWLSDGGGARRVVRVLARLAAWAVGKGLPLDAEVVLDPDTVERFVAVGLARRSVAGDLPGDASPGWAAADDAGAVGAEAGTVAHRQVALPYSAEELDGLSAMRAASADGRTGCARLGRCWRSGRGRVWTGGGLPGSPRTCRSRRRRCSFGSGSPRLASCRSWPSGRTSVLDLAGRRATSSWWADVHGPEPGWLVGGVDRGRSRASKLSASRLRSTWLVTHLAMGTRLPELARGRRPAGRHGAVGSACRSCPASTRRGGRDAAGRS